MYKLSVGDQVAVISSSSEFVGKVGIVQIVGAEKYGVSFDNMPDIIYFSDEEIAFSPNFTDEEWDTGVGRDPYHHD